MAIRYGWNFRATEGYATESPGEVPELRLAYTAMRGYGWDNVDGVSVNARDRNSSLDRRLAGCHFTSVAGKYWRVDLPKGPGRYRVYAGMHDAGAPNDARWDFQDGGSTFSSVDTATSTTEGRDATGAAITPSDFATTNGGTPLVHTFASGHLLLSCRSGITPSYNSIISHIALEPLTPLNLTAPVLATDGTVTSGTWDSQSNGTITRTATLHLASDNSLVATLYTANPDFSSYVTPGQSYYVIERASNDGGYDDTEDTQSNTATIAGGGSSLTGFRLGNTTINKMYLGSTEIKKAYLGSTLIYDKTAP